MPGQQWWEGEDRLGAGWSEGQGGEEAVAARTRLGRARPAFQRARRTQRSMRGRIPAWLCEDTQMPELGEGLERSWRPHGKRRPGGEVTACGLQWAGLAPRHLPANPTLPHPSQAADLESLHGSFISLQVGSRQLQGGSHLFRNLLS